MIFIFGYHPITRTIGPVEEKECANCHHTKHWVLHKRTYYINLFFIPVIPTKTEYYTACPVCQFREELIREDFKTQEPLARLNRLAVEENMSADEYNQRLEQLT